MHTDPRGVMRIIPVFLPAHIVQWIDDHASSRSQYLRRALVDELPAVDADPLVRRGAATYPRGAPDWKESRVRVPLDTFEDLKRVARRKRMPWAELARVCVLRTVRRDTLKEKT